MSRILPIQFQYELAYHPGNLIQSCIENENKTESSFFARRRLKQLSQPADYSDPRLEILEDPADFSESPEQAGTTTEGSVEESTTDISVRNFPQNDSLQAQFLSSLVEAGDARGGTPPPGGGGSSGRPAQYKNPFPVDYNRYKFQARKRAAWKTVNEFRNSRRSRSPNSSNYKIAYPNLQAGPVEGEDVQDFPLEEMDAVVEKIGRGAASGVNYSTATTRPLSPLVSAEGLQAAQQQQRIGVGSQEFPGSFYQQKRPPPRQRELVRRGYARAGARNSQPPSGRQPRELFVGNFHRSAVGGIRTGRSRASEIPAVFRGTVRPQLSHVSYPRLKRVRQENSRTFHNGPEMRQQIYEQQQEAAVIVQPQEMNPEEEEKKEIIQEEPPQAMYTNYSYEIRRQGEEEEAERKEAEEERKRLLAEDQRRRMEEEQQQQYQSMVEEAEKEFLPESAGGILRGKDQGAKHNAQVSSESEEELEAWCAELEVCVKEELEEESKPVIKPSARQLYDTSAETSSITEEDIFGTGDLSSSFEEKSKVEQEEDEDYHPQDPHPAPPPKRWWERDEEVLWKCIFAYLDVKDLCKVCLLVSKQWYEWIMECEELWTEMDLSGAQGLTQTQLVSVGKRRPKKLNLSWTGISREDVEVCLQLAEDLQALSLAGCHWTAVEAMKSCPGSLIELDLRWVQGCTDSNFKKLVGESPRLKQLECLFLSGCDVGDTTVRLIANQFSKIRSLDFSYCAKITNLSLEVLCAAGSAARRTLRNLNLAGCGLLEAEIFGHLQKMQTLNHLDLRACPKLSERECLDFESACRALKKNISVMC